MTFVPEQRQQRVRDWTERLYKLMVEMEDANGEPERGMYPDKLESLTRFAWEEGRDEMKRLEGTSP